MWDEVTEQSSYEVAGHIETSYEVGSGEYAVQWKPAREFEWTLCVIS